MARARTMQLGLSSGGRVWTGIRSYRCFTDKSFQENVIVAMRGIEGTCPHVRTTGNLKTEGMPGPYLV